MLWDDHATAEEARVWEPVPPFAPPPVPDPGDLPPDALALLRRLDRWAERMIARHPALADAIRRDRAAEAAEAAD